MLAQLKKKSGRVILINQDGKKVATVTNTADAQWLRFCDDYAHALAGILDIKPEEGEEPDFEALFHKVRAMALQALTRQGK